METPDYQGGSLVNLMSSILRARGATTAAAGYPPLRDADAALEEALAGARSLVLLVIDGLGYEYLTHTHPRSHITAALRLRLTSVFPTTTATAVTTLLSGLAPQQHGLPGWFSYLREVGSVVAVLPFRARHGGPSLARLGIPPRAILDWPPLFDRLGQSSLLVSPQSIAESDFSVTTGGRAARRPFEDLDGLFAVLQRLVRKRGAPRYIHAYWPELDSLGHRFGVGSSEVAEEFGRLDAALARFMDSIQGSDTLVLLTADHGMIDTRPERLVHLDAHPQLARTLRLPLCGEPRVAYCYVEPDRHEAFEDYVRDEFQGFCSVYASSALLEQGLYGSGAVHPRFAERLGDYTLLMSDHAVIKDRLLGERPFDQIGVHGGLTSAELYVPLAVFPT